MYALSDWFVDHGEQTPRTAPMTAMKQTMIRAIADKIYIDTMITAMFDSTNLMPMDNLDPRATKETRCRPMRRA